MASGPEHYAAAEQMLALAESTNSAMALRSAGTHAQLALAASNVAIAMQQKPAATPTTTEMTAWVKATASAGTLPTIKVGTDGLFITTTKTT